MAAEILEEYELASEEATHENTGEQASMIFMESGGEIQESENTPPWMEREHSHFPSLTGTENTNWEAAAIQMSV